MTTFFQKLMLLGVFIGLGQSSVMAQKVVDLARSYIVEQQANWGLQEGDVAELELSDVYKSAHNGVTHVYLAQAYEGIEVFNALATINVLASGKVFFAQHDFVADLATKVNATTPVLAPSEAIVAAALHLEIASLDYGKLEGTTEGTTTYEGGAVSASPIQVDLRYVRMGDVLRLAWNLAIDMHTTPDYWNVRVDALTGDVIGQGNYTVYCQHDHVHTGACALEDRAEYVPTILNNNNTDGATYHVFPVPLESPTHGERQYVVNPADSTASPFGWHDVNGVPGAEFTITRGNNVHAFADTTATNESQGDEPNGGDSLYFDFPFFEDTEPAEFLDFATTQLFYMNNMLHDFTYAYGFTEEAGNFQQNNYGRNGAGGDAVIAHAQDHDGTNNANFGTPPDGGNGQMQMYRWNQNGLATITFPTSIAGTYETRSASFGPEITDSTYIEAEIGLADDGTSSPTLGCSELQNDLTGKIALIDRGQCFFSDKVYHAELVGAVGAIICNHSGGSFAGMSAGNDVEITIPALMIDFADCQRIREFIGQGLTMVIALPEDSGPSFIDGTLDNGIVAHEYGHGISNRLTGGPSRAECLFNDEQMGEGWSDFFSLVTSVRPGDVGTGKRGIGTYAQQQPTDGNGIRRYPYSTDKAINAQTYNDVIGTTSPHQLGEIWASSLWDLYWAMVDQYGFDDDLYYGTGGNNMAIQLVMDGMKFQSCSPSIIQGRDAILAADLANNEGANQCLIWSIFAERGLGWSAEQGSSANRHDGREQFDLLPTCIQELKITKTVTEEILPGDLIDVQILVTNHKLEAVTDLKITDLLPDGTGFEQILTEGIEVSVENGVLSMGIPTLATGEELEINYQLNTSESITSVASYIDDVESGDSDWLFDPLTGLQIWNIEDKVGVDESAAWVIRNSRADNDQVLAFVNPILVTGAQPSLRFEHRFNTEAGFDGGIVQISTDNGFTWEMVDENMFRNGYATQLAYGAFAIPEVQAFAGRYNSFRATYVDLSEYLGQEILFRFRYSMDEETNTDIMILPDGWIVDNIELLDLANYNSEVCVQSGEGDMACASAPSRGTLIKSTVFTSTEEIAPSSLQVELYPNPAQDYCTIHIQTTQTEELDFQLYTLDGKLVYQQAIRVHEGSNQLPISTSSLESGFYLAKINGATAHKIQKLIIE